MSRRHPSISHFAGVIPRETLLSRDEAIGLVVALACALTGALLFLSLPVTARADEPGDPGSMGEDFDVLESDAVGADGVAPEADRELGERAGQTMARGLATGSASDSSTVPSNFTPLIVAAAIMGVALAIALIVSHAHAKPQKLGGAKGDVW